MRAFTRQKYIGMKNIKELRRSETDPVEDQTNLNTNLKLMPQLNVLKWKLRAQGHCP